MRKTQWLQDNAPSQCLFFLAHEVTFIQSQIISYPFSLLAERKNTYSAPSSFLFLCLRFSVWCELKGTHGQLRFRQYKTEVIISLLCSQRCGDDTDVGCRGITSANGV